MDDILGLNGTQAGQSKPRTTFLLEQRQMHLRDAWSILELNNPDKTDLELAGLLFDQISNKPTTTTIAKIQLFNRALDRNFKSPKTLLASLRKAADDVVDLLVDLKQNIKS